MQEDVKNIEKGLQEALGSAIMLQQKVFDTEGDSDLFRKLSCYLVPNLQRWVDGAQAGGIKDLNETLERRAREKN